MLNKSSKKIMMTSCYELTGDMVELKSLKNMDKNYVYDARLEMVMPRTNLDRIGEIIVNYHQSFCELVNRDPSCRPAMLTANGFVPVGIEPTVLVNKMFSFNIKRKLESLGIPCFYYKQLSPLSTSFEYKDDVSAHDVWVNKIDAAEVLGKRPHEIRAIDLLEVALG